MMVTLDDMIAIVRSTNILDAETRDIDATASFYEQGIDSLDALSIVLRVEEKYGVKVPDEEFESLDSLAALAAYVNAHAPQAAS